MQWVKALHVIFMVTWFSGLFYLPRLFVYHADATDAISNARFKIMERKLYFGIATPGAILTLLFGAWAFYPNFAAYLQMKWMLLKIALVFFLLIYHVYLGKIWYLFKHDRNPYSHVFYRWLNEVPVFFLVTIIILVIVKPFGIIE